MNWVLVEGQEVGEGKDRRTERCVLTQVRA